MIDFREQRKQLNSAYDSLRATLRRAEKRLDADEVRQFYDAANEAIALANVETLHAVIDRRVAELDGGVPDA